MVIATDKEEVVPIVQKVTEGKGVYGGLDAVAGNTTGTLIETTRPGGRIIVYGIPLSSLSNLVLRPNFPSGGRIGEKTFFALFI